MTFGRPDNRHDPEVLGLLRDAADNAAASTDLLAELLDAWPERAELGQRLIDLEHAGDDITHRLISTLHSGRLPGDLRGDLLTLASKLDDITDLAEETAGMLALYDVEAPMQQGADLARILAAAAHAVAGAVATLPDTGGLSPQLATIHELENDGDRVSRAAVASLFAGGIDPMVVIRWKDIYERLEQAIDACEQTADVLATLALKS